MSPFLVFLPVFLISGSSCFFGIFRFFAVFSLALLSIYYANHSSVSILSPSFSSSVASSSSKERRCLPASSTSHHPVRLATLSTLRTRWEGLDSSTEGCIVKLFRPAHGGDRHFFEGRRRFSEHQAPKHTPKAMGANSGERSGHGVTSLFCPDQYLFVAFDVRGSRPRLQRQSSVAASFRVCRLTCGDKCWYIMDLRNVLMGGSPSGAT